jgi:hypothetical protein
MKTAKCFLTVAAAVSALVAAFLWYKSSDVRVKPARPDPNSWEDAQITVGEGKEESDFIATAQEQTRWSKRAALAACVSASFQAVALLFPE